ncbi:MAG TPA: secretion protein F, partial [Bacillota bacterium]|nr:secretion protein F [Bacillota bacterium]
PRLVAHIDKTLKHNRDVLYILDNYKENTGPEMKHELEITVADMRSGNYEAALTRLEARVGSSMLSDVTRGLIGVLRGDETEVYWSSLAVKFADYQRQLLKQQAQKVPSKVKRLSMCLLFCFMLIYIVVIGMEIMNSIGVLFG